MTTVDKTTNGDKERARQVPATDVKSLKARATGLPIFIFMATKGGCNKSTACMSFRCYLQCQNKTVIVLDSDKNNPDVFDAISASERGDNAILIDTNTEQGNLAFARVIQNRPDDIIFLNRPGGDLDVVIENAGVIKSVASSLNRPVVVIWPIDTSDDAFKHLPDVMDEMEGMDFWVFRPQIFGKPDQFVEFNASEIGRSLIAENRVIDMPRMSEVVFSEFKGRSRTTPAALYAKGDLVTRAAIENWRGKLDKAFGVIAREYLPDDAL